MFAAHTTYHKFLGSYADPNEYNRLFYHQRNDDMEQIIQMLPEDSNVLVEAGTRRLRTKEDGTMNSSALQSPSNSDTTYKNKSGTFYRSYAANIKEAVGKMVL